jgi:CelD/BcsL family acetyltransferase involved in cellulose biosynthesis
MVEMSKQLTSRVIQKEGEWDAIQDDWNYLYASSPYSSTPLDFVWLRSWWRVYGELYGTDGLRVVTVWRGSRLAAAVPLYVSRGLGSSFGGRHLRFISTGEAEHEETCPDYLNLLCLSGEEAACVDSIWEEVGRLAWDRLEFLDLAEDSPLLRATTVPHSVRSFSRGSCHVADLSSGFESYLGRLSSNNRQQARRLLREGERAGAQFELVDADRAAGAFDDLVRLHQERWRMDGKPGVFAAPRFIKFHRNLVKEWLPRGRAVLARLSIEGNPVVVLYGFVTGQKFDFYQSGVQREIAGPLRSPGNLAHLLLMRALTERGVAAYDFLRGSLPYKQRLTTRQNHLVGVRIWRQTLRAVSYRLIQFAGRVVGKQQWIVVRS